MHFYLNMKLSILLLLIIIVGCNDLQKENYFPIYEDNNWKIINTEGVIKQFANNYEVVSPFIEGFAIIKNVNNFGFISLNGDIILEPNYSVFPFNNGLAHIIHGKQSFYINQKEAMANIF